ncbi:peptidase [Streptomyces sp. NPDC058280]|uniref:peptidase n=1 Tax=Streptomyces sp. NPDC058280 TaxID=3346419 RepID=UPI0036E62C06
MSIEEVESTAGDVVEGAAVEMLAAKRYPVAPGYRVNVRSGPGTNYQVVRVLPYGASVPINCQKPGESVSGPYGTSNIWDNIANGQFISDSYVQTGSDGYVAVRCG